MENLKYFKNLFEKIWLYCLLYFVNKIWSTFNIDPMYFSPPWIRKLNFLLLSFLLVSFFSQFNSIFLMFLYFLIPPPTYSLLIKKFSNYLSIELSNPFSALSSCRQEIIVSFCFIISLFWRVFHSYKLWLKANCMLQFFYTGLLYY